MFMLLACASLFAAVIKSEAFIFCHAEPKGLEILQRQEGVLVLILSGDEEEMVSHDIILIQDRKMRLRNISDYQVPFRRTKRIGIFSAFFGSFLLFPCLVLESKACKDSDKESNATIFNKGKISGHRHKCPGSESVLRSPDDILPTMHLSDRSPHSLTPVISRYGQDYITDERKIAGCSRCI